MDKLAKVGPMGLDISKAKEVEVRRNMLEVPEVSKALDHQERMIFQASTDTLIREMTDSELITVLSERITYIMYDLGIKDHKLSQYDYARIMDLLQNYYSGFSVADFQLAFDKCLGGELDEYLPLRDGKPDRNHYQRFSMQYITMVLNAYRKVRNGVLAKAREHLPAPKSDLTEEQKIRYRKERFQSFLDSFNQFMETGDYVFSPIKEMQFHDYMVELCRGNGENQDPGSEQYKYWRKIWTFLVPETIPSDYELAKREKMELGISGAFLHQGSLAESAYTFARRRALRKTLDYLVEINFELLKYIQHEL